VEATDGAMGVYRLVLEEEPEAWLLRSAADRSKRSQFIPPCLFSCGIVRAINGNRGRSDTLLRPDSDGRGPLLSL
jgi:hypothetical protein